MMLWDRIKTYISRKEKITRPLNTRGDPTVEPFTTIELTFDLISLELWCATSAHQFKVGNLSHYLPLGIILEYIYIYVRCFSPSTIAPEKKGVSMRSQKIGRSFVVLRMFLHCRCFAGPTDALAS